MLNSQTSYSLLQVAVQIGMAKSVDPDQTAACNSLLFSDGAN